MRLKKPDSKIKKINKIISKAVMQVIPNFLAIRRWNLMSVASLIIYWTHHHHRHRMSVCLQEYIYFNLLLDLDTCLSFLLACWKLILHNCKERRPPEVTRLVFVRSAASFFYSFFKNRPHDKQFSSNLSTACTWHHFNSSA